MGEDVTLTAEDGFKLSAYRCDERGSYHEPSATLARGRTQAFLRPHVG